MSDGKITYTITAEDKFSDVTAKIKTNFKNVGKSAREVADAFRAGGWRGAVEHLKGLKINGLAASPVFRHLVMAINPVTAAMTAIGAAAIVFAAAMRTAIKAMVEFQSQTFNLAPLVGGLREARQVMLQLTEGKYAVDHVFGQGAVVKAYRNLHTYSNGALATARNVKLMGEVAARTGQDLAAVSNSVGMVWQRIVRGDELASLKEIFSLMRLDPSLIPQLEQMRDAGASAGDLWARFSTELEKANGTLAAQAGSIDDLNKRIADAKGTIATAGGEWFEPVVSGWKRAELAILEGIAKIDGKKIRLALQLSGKTGRVIAAIDGLTGGRLIGNRSRKAEADTGETDPVAAANAAQEQQLEAQMAIDWRDAQKRQKIRRRDEREAAMPATDLDAEADSAKRAGRIADWERLTIAAEKARERAAADADAAALAAIEAEKAARERAAAEEARQIQHVADLRKQLAERQDAARLDAMSPEARLAELERRAGDAAFRSLDPGVAGASAGLEMFDLQQRADAERAAIAEQAQQAAQSAAQQRQAQLTAAQTAAQAAAQARSELAQLTAPQKASIDTVARMDWMRDVRGGRPPEDETAENTRDIKEILKRIEQAGGIQ
jgi:hypothetical protein